MLTTLGNRSYTQKPVGMEIGQLQNELMVIGTTEISPLELLYAVGQDGRSFKPAIYTEGSALHNDDFLQTEVIGIDIDVKEGKPWTIADSLEVLRKNELDYIGIYKSFSYSEEHQNHRILFELPAPIYNDNMFYFTLMLFNELFPADTACFDKARMFFGGKGVIEGTRNPLRLDNLYYACINEMSNDKNNNSTRRIDDFCAKAKLNKVNGLPDVDISKTDDTTTVPIYIYRSSGDIVNNGHLLIFPHFTEQIVITTSKSKTTKVKKGDKPVNVKYSYGQEIYPLDNLKDECELYGAVTRGHWATHEQLKILCWNFHPIQGVMDSIVNALLPHERKELNLNYKIKVNGLISSALKGEYEPKKCSSDCPYFDECKIMKKGYKSPYNYISAKRIKPITKLQPHERFQILAEVTNDNGDLPSTSYEIPLQRNPLNIVQEEANMKFSKCMDTLITGQATDLIVLKAPTGIGKTKMLIETDWSQFTGKKVAIAFPTHALKDEVAIEFLKLGISIGIKPDKNKAEIRDTVLKNRIDRLFEAGNINASKEYHKYLNAHKEIPEYSAYLDQQANFQSADILLTTHADVLLNKTDRFDYLIIDEDILITSCETNSIKRSSIEATVLYLKHILDINYMLVQDILDFIADNSRSTCMLNKYNDYNSLYAKYQHEIENIMINQPDLDVEALKILTADYVMKSVNVLGEEYIHFGKRRKLPRIPVMIMSATTFEAVYRVTYRYERDIQFFNIDYVSDCGLLEQDLTYSFSRSDLNSNSERNIQYIKNSLQNRGKDIKDYTVITFKGSKSLFIQAGFTVAEDIHYGNTSGYNSYTGKNLIVAGTPHISSTDIKLYSILLFDVVVPEADYEFIELENQKRFNINGIRINFPSFTNPYVRLIQFYLLQSDILQAVGRSRLIRNPEAEVQLFSNFPIEEADNYYENMKKCNF